MISQGCVAVRHAKETRHTQNTHDILAFTDLMLQSFVSSLECRSLLVDDADGSFIHRIRDLLHALARAVRDHLDDLPAERRGPNFHEHGQELSDDEVNLRGNRTTTKDIIRLPIARSKVNTRSTYK